MATLKQKRVARKIVENLNLDKPLTGGEIVESSGYGPSMKKNPQVILESDGVKEELNNLGFSLEEADKTVAFLLKNAQKEETKLNAATQIYKRLGGYAPDKSINMNVEVEPDEKIKQAAAMLNAIHRERSLTSDGAISSSVGTEAQDKE